MFGFYDPVISKYLIIVNFGSKTLHCFLVISQTFITRICAKNKQLCITLGSLYMHTQTCSMHKYTFLNLYNIVYNSYVRVLFNGVDECIYRTPEIRASQIRESIILMVIRRLNWAEKHLHFTSFITWTMFWISGL